MPFDVSRVIPLAAGHELRRDFADVVAAAMPTESPPSVRDVWSAFEGEFLDFLWTEVGHEREFVRRLRELAAPATRVLMIARAALLEVARELPSDDPLGRKIERLLAGEGLRGDDALIVGFDDHRTPFVGLVGPRAAVEPILRYCRRLADETVPVLVTGETGTGKEVVARALHRLGRRRSRPWLAVNCAALPESILESELFGHVRGAFTGAVADRAGLFEAAGDGTVFLDEVGELPAAAQAKCLRVLEEHRVRRLGSAEARPLRCRVVAATNRTLAAEVDRGRFRADLFYRLRGAEIALPALRDRAGDVVPLAELFAARAALRFRRRTIGLSEEAQLALASHGWPGNVRELRQVIESAVLTAEEGWVRMRDLAIAFLPQPSPEPAPLLTVQALERAHILRALASTSGNKVAAARLLGLTRQSLLRRLRRHGITLPVGNHPPRPESSAEIGQCGSRRAMSSDERR